MLVALWMVLSGAESESLLLGAVSVALALAASLALSPVRGPSFSILALLHFLPWFLWHSIQSGVQVGLLAFQPRRMLTPAVVEVPLRLQEAGARNFLACALNLMPGTVTAGLEGPILLLHVLDDTQDVVPMVRTAERRVGRLFAEHLP